MLWALPFLRLLLPPVVLPASLAPETEPAQAAAAAPLAASIEVAAAAPQPETVAIAAPVVSAPPAAAAPVWSWSDLAGVVLSVWLGVALVFLAWRVVTYRRMRRELLAEARPVGEAGRIRLVETLAVAAPVAFGVLDKVIALPPLFMAQPDRLARDLAIEHELAHHRGHDLLANFAAQALLALHWFNPLAWLGWRAMRRDQEAACDARVLAGRSREERARYAALIARVAAGPRKLTFNGALAAPMAGRFGEKSIIYRLRSLSMSDVTRRRRWLGHGLIATGALALPLTASISYTAANAQPAAPVPPVPPAPSAVEAPPLPAEPAAPAVEGGETRSLVIRRTGPDGETVVREVPLPHPAPAPYFSWQGNVDSEEFRRGMEQFQRDMEEWREQHGDEWAKWGEEYGEYWRQWGEQQREQALTQAERRREQAARQREQGLARAERQREQAAQQRQQALARAERQREQAAQQREQAQARAQAWADAARYVPAVVQSCDEDEKRRTTTADGRPRVVICPRDMKQIARSSLRFARNSIAHNPEISDDVRTEVLQDLDEELERIEREND